MAEFYDWRDYKYYLVNDPDQYETPNADLWVLQKVLPNGNRITVLNPYCIEGTIKDATLIGDNLYVINTTYRSGDNLACLNTRTGKWSNPIPECSQCSFVCWNTVWVEYAELIYEGECTADNRYRCTYTMVDLE
ncbi:MAG: hypothetical protein K2H87_04430 [Duncaniella sp.]|nr:hypothetical protein [Duncaniella sp.]